MRIAIAGGNGFIGKAIGSLLLSHQHQLYILSRKPEKLPQVEGITYVSWLGKDDQPEAVLEGIDVFINLAGVSLNSGRWTAARKKAIRSSRENSTREVVRIIHALNKKPAVLLQASAVGYYGTSNPKVFIEEDVVPASDFLSSTVHDWEQAAQQSGVRTVLMRFGVVLGSNGGAFPAMQLPYSFFLGGRIGSGRQPLPWIHIEDAARAVWHCIQCDDIIGPVNFTAPDIITMDEFGAALAKNMQRPHWFPLPSGLMKLLLGEMSMLLLEGQRVHPSKLLGHQFSFNYSDIHSALANLIQMQKIK